MNEIPGELWDEYELLQRRSQSNSHIGPQAWAIEDQLDTFLASLSDACLPQDSSERRKQLTNLVLNRQKKHRHRAKLLESFAATQTEVSPEKLILDKLIQAEQLARVRSLISLQEWRILMRLARDDDYKTVAQKERISVAALKTRVSRCRGRLRERVAA
jgi:hypothetical protein